VYAPRIAAPTSIFTSTANWSPGAALTGQGFSAVVAARAEPAIRTAATERKANQRADGWRVDIGCLVGASYRLDPTFTSRQS
jgi:hypothetical protein